MIARTAVFVVKISLFTFWQWTSGRRIAPATTLLSDFTQFETAPSLVRQSSPTTCQTQQNFDAAHFARQWSAPREGETETSVFISSNKVQSRRLSTSKLRIIWKPFLQVLRNIQLMDLFPQRACFSRILSLAQCFQRVLADLRIPAWREQMGPAVSSGSLPLLINLCWKFESAQTSFLSMKFGQSLINGRSKVWANR